MERSDIMPVHFIHITDLHLSHPDLNDANCYSDTVANLRLLVSKLGDITPPPAFVVASGDLTNHGDRASYQLVRDILGALDIPVVHALGNHDNRAAFRTVFSGFPGAERAPPEAPYFHQTRLGGLQIITLDSTSPGRVGGHICEPQFDFLERALRDAPDRPKLLNIHHPPLIAGESLAWESLNRRHSDRLAEILMGQNVAGMVCGHIHFNRVSLWHGIPVIVSNGLHATIDVLKRRGMQIEEGTGFGHCIYRASGLSVSFVPLTPKRAILGQISGDVLKSFR